MNTYIRAQIDNITAIMKTFTQSCTLAAQKDDGQINSDEAKTLRRITTAAEKFIREMEKIK